MVGATDASVVMHALHARTGYGVFNRAVKAEVFGRFDIRESLRKNAAFAFDFTGADAFFGYVDDSP